MPEMHIGLLSNGSLYNYLVDTCSLTYSHLTGFTFSYCISFGMAFLVSTFIVFVVNERATKAKQSQFIAGIGSTNFWLSAFLWDALCFLVPSMLVIAVVAAFQTGGYSDKEVIGLVAVN